MSDQPNKPVDRDLIEAYLLGQLSEEAVAAFEQTLRRDPALLHQLAEAMQLMSLVRQEFAGQAEYQAANQHEPLLQDFNSLLKELGEHEASAKTVHFPVQTFDDDQPEENADSLSPHDLVAVGGYVLRKAITSKPAILAAAAAFVLLATVLVFNWAGDSRDELAETPSAPTLATPDRAVVATLTAEHNATWAEGASANGSQLRAGDRLTLTTGFAEITTNRGAVAILKAPCTVELMGDGHALRLHTGKLVGICETNSSKGFAVHTPHMIITDLGTRFGVVVRDDSASLAEVFDGLIRVQTRSSSGVDSELTSGQAFAVNTIGAAVPVDTFDSDLFAGLLAVHEGITALSSETILVPADAFIGNVFDAWPTDQQVMIFREPVRMRLTEDLPVSNAGVGEQHIYLTGEVLQDPPVVPKGSAIRSYVLALNPEQREGTTDVQGSVTFEGEVLGVIYTTAEWQGFLGTAEAAGQRAFQSEPGKYFIERVVYGGLERPGISDRLFISEDKRTLNFRIYSKGYCDTVRVIVREPIEEHTD